MGRIYLVRHPATHMDPDTPAEQWGLSDEGLSQLDRLLQARWWTDVRHVYTSTEQKARAVGDAVLNQFGIPCTSHAELRELERTPEFRSDYRERVIRMFATPDVPVDGWESLSSATDRLTGFLRGTVSGGPIPAAVVSHGIVLSSVRARLLGMSHVDPRHWQALPFAAVAEVETDDWTLASDFAPE
ncbi:MAG: histidine phosphatase family protein [Dehalococcoidia bacterium]